MSIKVRVLHHTLRSFIPHSILELELHCVTRRITLIAPFRLDSVIHQIPEKRTSSTIGSPRVAVYHARLVWGGKAKGGNLYHNRLGISVWMVPFADPLGSHLRSRRETSSKGPLFNRSGTNG